MTPGQQPSWSGVAGVYRESFATLCGGTVERLLIDTPGTSHLDVGSGTGALAARAAALGRNVVAVDADSEMVAMSHDVVPGCAAVATLPRLPFEDAVFDAVTANFVVNHVGDPRAAMRELARVTRPRGRVAVTIWPAERPGWAALVAAAFTAAGVVAITGQWLSPALDFERSVAGLRGLAEAADLEAVTATELRWDWEVSASALWAGIAGGIATAGQTFLAQTPEVQEAAEHEFRLAAERLTDHGLLRLPSSAAYVVAAPL